MNYRDPKTTIGNVVAMYPKTTSILTSYGIDYCCGGHRLLQEVLHEEKINAEKLYQALDTFLAQSNISQDGANFLDMTSEQLSSYIEDTHHTYLREHLPNIAELLATIMRVHGSKHPELFEVYRLFGSLKSDLEQHLLKEEQLLFPALETKQTETIRTLSNTIIQEHEHAGSILLQLRHETNHFTVPEDGCNTYRHAYELLADLEADLHEHIHLENNILLAAYDTRSQAH